LPQPISPNDRTKYPRPAIVTCPELGRRTPAAAPRRLV
jgi:hypothetical protein